MNEISQNAIEQKNPHLWGFHRCRYKVDIYNLQDAEDKKKPMQKTKKSIPLGHPECALSETMHRTHKDLFMGGICNAELLGFFFQSLHRALAFNLRQSRRSWYCWQNEGTNFMAFTDSWGRNHRIFVVLFFLVFTLILSSIDVQWGSKNWRIICTDTSRPNFHNSAISITVKKWPKKHERDKIECRLYIRFLSSWIRTAQTQLT